MPDKHLDLTRLRNVEKPNRERAGNDVGEERADIGGLGRRVPSSHARGHQNQKQLRRRQTSGKKEQWRAAPQHSGSQ